MAILFPRESGEGKTSPSAGFLKRFLVEKLRPIQQAALDMTYPPVCAACGECLVLERPANLPSQRVLCLDCAKKIKWLGADACGRCGHPQGTSERILLNDRFLCRACRDWPKDAPENAVAVAQYKAPWRDIILALKFSRAEHLTPVLGKLLAARVENSPLYAGASVLAPVPLRRKVFLARGFNQAEEIALVAGKILSLPVDGKLLQKVRDTRPQALLSAKERRENLRGAFALNNRRARRWVGKKAILVDDVMTTGATTWECRRALSARGGVAAVCVAVMARSVVE